MKLLSSFNQEIQNMLFEIRSQTASLCDDISYAVPFVCQFALPEHAELSLKKELDPNADQHWSLTGASSPQRYAQWAFTMCGMASAAMALKFYTANDHKPALLAEDALRHGVYTEDTESISGMRYKEFALWIQKYGLQADVYSRLSIRGIQSAISEGRLVMISVNPNIRGYTTAPVAQRGGHLVLVTGYSIPNATILINNPSGFVSTNTQVSHSIPMNDFKKFYARRGIVLSPLEHT